jgi:GntR family transcriptional regulator, transcriptional repressor for pyruvate dehydrogenase complex
LPRKTDSEFSPRPVTRPREQVEAQIKNAIITGQFAQGERLPSEGELAQRFTVSRATVREALRSLVSIGMIEKVPGAMGGSFVRNVDHEALGKILRESVDNTLQLGQINLDEVVAVRAVLEIPCAQLAARHRTPQHLEQIREVIDLQRDAALDDERIPQLDLLLHRTIGEASRNRVLLAFVTALHTIGKPIRFLELSPEVGRETVRQHLLILGAIEEQDEEAAGEAMQRHLDYLAEHGAEGA